MTGHLLSIILILSLLYLIHSYDIASLANNQSKNNIHSNNQIKNNFIGQPNIPPVTSHGFHDHFAKKNKFDNNKLLGWRHWYLKNKSNYLVKPTNNFNDIPTRHYLNNLGNTDNWFYNLYSSNDPKDNIIE